MAIASTTAASVPVPTPTAGTNAQGSYYPQATQTPYEYSARVSAPQYMSSLGANGQLKAPFSYDPTQSSAFNAMAQTATSSDLSPWAQMQMQQLGLNTAQQKDATAAQTLGSMDQARQAQMTTGGGISSGASQQLAQQGARNNIMAQQNIGAQQEQNAMGIQQADAQNKANMLGQVANTETGALAANTQTANQDLQNENMFSSNRYNQQMSAWGAQKTAQGQMAAANAGKK